MEILFGRDPWAVLAAFAVCGFVCGVLADVLYVKRLFFGAFRIVLAVDDLLFSLICGALFIVCAYAFGNGNIRWYEFPAMTAGFVFEYMTLSRFVRLLFGGCARQIKRLLGVLCRPIIRMYGKRKNAVRAVLYSRRVTHLSLR